jgi:hypothetical protein
MSKYIFGPVPSRRLGRSLGVDRVLPAGVQKLLRRGGGAHGVRQREDQRAGAGGGVEASSVWR